MAPRAASSSYDLQGSSKLLSPVWDPCWLCRSYRTQWGPSTGLEPAEMGLPVMRRPLWGPLMGLVGAMTFASTSRGLVTVACEPPVEAASTAVL